MMREIIQLSEARRNGHVNNRRFVSNVCSRLGDDLVGGAVKIEYNRGVVPTDDFELDVDIVANRLVLYNVSGTILLYDVTPRSQPYTLLTTIQTQRTARSVIPPTIRWGLDCSYVSLSGNGHGLEIYDPTSFELVEVSSRPRELIYCHECHPINPGMIAAGCVDAVAVIDLRSAARDSLFLQKCDVNGIRTRLHSSENVNAMNVAWNQEDEYSLVCSTETTNYAFDIRFPRRSVRSFEFKKQPGPVQSFFVSPCTKFVTRFLVASAYSPRFLAFYNILTGKESLLELSKEKARSTSQSFKRRFYMTLDVDRDGGHIYLGDGNEIVVYNFNASKIVASLKGHVFEIIKIKFNRPTKELFSFACHFQATVWSPKPYTCLM